MKVLLAIDGSTFSDVAIDEVAMRSWPEGTEIRALNVVHVISDWPDPIFYGVRLEALVQERKESRAIMDKATTKLLESLGEKFAITGEILEGSPKKLIVREAENWKADLIIVGSHGRGAIGKLILGSVSSYVASHAKCSVEIVQAKANVVKAVA
ncbi:MAG: universal stress protein [Acidobacteria bacterium]|nr:universal stress protein [Acidobacteriota bacterium]